jgi:hypothetical protein
MGRVLVHVNRVEGRPAVCHDSGRDQAGYEEQSSAHLELSAEFRRDGGLQAINDRLLLEVRERTS